MKILLTILLAVFTAWAAHPGAFEPLGAQLEAELEALRVLGTLDTFDADAIEAYAARQQRCFKDGYLLDAALASDAPQRAGLRTRYLSCLRMLQDESRRWQHRYAGSLDAAIEQNDRHAFEVLVTHPLEPLQRPSLRRKALDYYETFRAEEAIAAMEALRSYMQIEERTPAFLSTEKNAFEKDQSVLSTAQAGRSRRPVLVSTRQEGSRFVFYAENKNIYPVTLTLSFTKLENFKASKPLPMVFELGPYAKLRVLELDIADRRKAASFGSRYGWVMGRLSARHSNPLYRLPFAVGSRVQVSQGFNGGVTHQGLTRYAVDFECPVGTKVYASRGGKVIAAESGHSKGGFDTRYGSEANYVIIEHDDHTLGKYYHLKQYGVMVRVGDSVRRGQFIAYSGNTGYSTGPHLHFSVSSVDPDSKNLPITLPFHFLSGRGVVDAPKTSDVYTVVKVH